MMLCLQSSANGLVFGKIQDQCLLVSGFAGFYDGSLMKYFCDNQGNFPTPVLGLNVIIFVANLDIRIKSRFHGSN